ncbi:MAG: hypothetical protein DRZ76_02340 [Candidatus Nealsonbacteria bacterium]|nr:MAG: hypothetical protein DRZ76_02340 [Candidatus Nealsonbacteria bacterium]
MANQELLNYIKQSLERGLTKEQIWEELRRAGWQEKETKRVFQELGLMEMDVLPDIGDLLERVFRLYKDRFWTLVGIMLPPFLLGWVGMIVWWLLIFAGMVTKISLENIVSLLFLVLLGLVFFVIFIAAGLWSQVALLCAIKEKDIGIKEAFRKGWHKIISYWWISVLSTLLVLGAFLLFFIPGIILAIWFSLVFYVFIMEDKKGMQALLRSKQLVAGKWWTVFWRKVLILLIIMGANLIIGLIPFVGRSGVAGLLTTPFLHVFGFLLYQDLKRFKKDSYFEPPKTATKLKFVLVAVMGYLLLATAITIWLVF